MPNIRKTKQVHKRTGVPPLVHIKDNVVWKNIKNISLFTAFLKTTYPTLRKLILNQVPEFNGFRLATPDDIATLPHIDQTERFPKVHYKTRLKETKTPDTQTEVVADTSTLPEQWATMTMAERLEYLIVRDSQKHLQTYVPPTKSYLIDNDTTDALPDDEASTSLDDQLMT